MGELTPGLAPCASRAPDPKTPPDTPEWEGVREAMDDVRYDGIAPGFEDYALAQRVAVTLTLRDATTGQATVLDGPALELPPSVVDGDALRL